MQKNRFKYLILIVFLVSILMIVFLQFNSGRSIQNLINDNKNLLHELQVQERFQKLETDIVFVESSIRGLVITQDSMHIEGVRDEINAIKTELDSIKSQVNDNYSPEMVNQLISLTNKKIEHNNEVLNSYYTKGKTAAEENINTNEGTLLRDSISNIIHQIKESRKNSLADISASVSTNGQRAKQWGIILAVIACLASVTAFWYLVDQGQRQQKLIHILDSSERKLKEASKIKEQFVANISHEIRTPMNAILGFAGLMQKTALDRNQNEYVKSIRSSAENLLTIINDILDLSRIESGMMHIEILPFNVKQLIDSLITMLNVKAKSRSLYLHAEIDESIPDILKGDAVRLTQILLNLISNALKFTHEGGVTVKVEEAERNNNLVSVRFIISDTGIGIVPEKQKNIFERFQQAEAETTRRYGGTGLGLAIVKQLVDIQNGNISVESDWGRGSKFTVVIPYVVSTDTESVAVSPALLSANEVSLKEIKLLVAEDNHMNRQLIQHLLQQWQIDFDIVTNGADAVKVLTHRSSDYHLVLMDIQMPEMDGYTATEKIRYELKLQIPIIAMTAHALAGEKEKCLAAGMDDYISKPLNEELLYRLISNHARKNKNAVKSLIDLEYLRSLSKGDVLFERRMMIAFTDQMPKDLIQLKTALDAKDYDTIKAIVHNLKSTISYIGLNQLVPLLQEMETEAENKTGMSIMYNNFALIEATCNLALKEVDEYISALT